jgi:hypothetical protein
MPIFKYDHIYRCKKVCNNLIRGEKKEGGEMHRLVTV